MEQRRGRVAVAICLVATFAFICSADWVNWHQHQGKAAAEPAAKSNLSSRSNTRKHPVLRSPATDEVVMTIGGSIAHGWKAPHDNGYLQQAFAKLSKFTPANYTYVDKTIIGANGVQLDTLYKGRYPKWLKTIQPDIVVISWGLLNDCKDKVSVSDFEQHLRNEIEPALQNQAAVFVVTPPVTKASYTQYLDSEETLVQAEIDTVKAENNPNVYVFDVFHQMKDYLSAHHQTYEPYMGDAWHPNLAGHTLAGDLLYQDFINQFGDQPVAFVSQPGTGGSTSGGGTTSGGTGSTTSGGTGSTTSGGTGSSTGSGTGSGATGSGNSGSTGSTTSSNSGSGNGSSGSTGSGSSGQAAASPSTGCTGSGSSTQTGTTTTSSPPASSTQS